MELYGKRAARTNAGDVYATISLLVGAALWGLIWFPMRMLERHGLHGVWLALVLYAAPLVVSLPWTAARVVDFARAPFVLALLALTAGWTNVAFVEAVLQGNILRVMLLFYLSPLWAVAMAWAFLGERPTRAAFVAIACALAGAVVMLWDPASGEALPANRAEWLALSSGFAFAASNVVVRKAQAVSIEAKSVAVWLGVAVVSAALIAGTGLALPVVSAALWLAAAALGIAAIVAMTVLVQYGVTRLPVHRSSVIMLFELVVGAGSQRLLTDETTRAVDWVGGALIVAGAYLAARAERSGAGS